MDDDVLSLITRIECAAVAGTSISPVVLCSLMLEAADKLQELSDWIDATREVMDREV